jgi:hypothetical protein
MVPWVGLFKAVHETSYLLYRAVLKREGLVGETRRA